ncbi:MAG: S-layer homology domain-containing protein [Bacteroidota bacterium]
MRQLNDNYNKRNTDLYKVPAHFRHLVADMEVEFCLASVKPDGTATSGINRYNYRRSANTITQMGYIQDETAWDSDSYMNVWIAAGFGFAGYSYFPGTVSKKRDGIVINYYTVGSTSMPNGVGNQYGRGMGKTLTHEVGHWLGGLRHTWGNGGRNHVHTCNDDDWVSDTPTQYGPSSGCTAQSTCGSRDLYVNYMDYSSDNCRVMFTKGQKDMLMATLDINRSTLLHSNGCGIPNASPLPTDVRGHWAEREIAHMLNKGYMSGYPNGTFRPENPLTRAEFATMLVKVLRLPVNTYNAGRFNDISSHWARTNILSAANAGYLSGYPNGTFRPNDKITRMQVNLSVANIGLTGGRDALLNVFNDQAQIPGWARRAIYRSLHNRFIASYPNRYYYFPNEKSTRANAVVVLYQALRRNGGIPSNQVAVNPYLVIPGRASGPDDGGSEKQALNGETTASLTTSKLSLYPNPVNDILYVQSASVSDNMKIEVYDPSGKTLYLSGNSLDRGLDVSSLRTGLYTARIVLDGQVIVKRFIKH